MAICRYGRLTPSSRITRGRRDDDVAAVSAEIDVFARDLPGALFASGVAHEVRMGAPGRRPNEPGPVLDESCPPSRLEGGEAGARWVDIHIDDVNSGGGTRRDAYVGVGPSRPPRSDDRRVGAGVLEAVLRQWPLAAWCAGEHGDVSVGELVGGGGYNSGRVRELVKHPWVPPSCPGPLWRHVVHDYDCPQRAHQKTPVLAPPVPGRARLPRRRIRRSECRPS